MPRSGRSCLSATPVALSEEPKLSDTTIRFISFPRTEPPPSFVPKVVQVFRQHERLIATLEREQHLKSDEVLAVLCAGLEAIGFSVEKGKQADQKIGRPVFFGENGEPTLRFEVDAYHAGWECGLEIEATRAIRGGALYRDLLQALVMVQVSHLCLGIPNLSSRARATRADRMTNRAGRRRRCTGTVACDCPTG